MPGFFMESLMTLEDVLKVADEEVTYYQQRLIQLKDESAGLCKQLNQQDARSRLTAAETYRDLLRKVLHTTQEPLLEAVRKAVEFLNQHPNGPAMPIATALNMAVARATESRG